MSECKHSFNLSYGKYCKICGLSIVDAWNLDVSNLEKERDAALAQVAVLAKERDRQRSYCAVLWQEVKGKCEECSAFFGGGCQDDGTCNLRRVLDLTYEAAERVNALVEALEKLARLGGPGDGYGNSDGNVIAQRALAAWRGQEN